MVTVMRKSLYNGYENTDIHSGINLSLSHVAVMILIEYEHIY